MTFEEQKKKLGTLPWQALYDLAISKEIDESEVTGKDKDTIITRLLSTSLVNDEEINRLVDDYIYGNRITFTIWTFNKSLSTNDYDSLVKLVDWYEPVLDSNYFRNLHILSVADGEDRFEILYVYSKEYSFTDEDGHDASVWEQHRGCLWIGKNIPYLACISKHDKMTSCIVRFISEHLLNGLTQIHPPKAAIEKCIHYKARSRVVLQGADGEKTIISRSGGFTEGQEEEISRIRDNRIDTSGSYLAEIADDVSASIKYNIKKGNIGILKHLPTSILFGWSKDAIAIIFEEIDKLKGKPATEIFSELGLELKWSVSDDDKDKMNWFLTHVIAALNHYDEYVFPLEEHIFPLLQNSSYFHKLPRVYCNICESYEVPHCAVCSKPLKFSANGQLYCDCGAPLQITCPEGHICRTNYWYIPTPKFVSMVNRNIQQAFKDADTKYFMCIMDGQVHIVHTQHTDSEGVEIAFADISCFSDCPTAVHEAIKYVAVRLNEKCDKLCTKANIEKCLKDGRMVCLPKLFYSVLPGYRPQPHKGSEYGDVSGEVVVGSTHYEMKGIIKKNTKNSTRISRTGDELVEEYLLSTAKEGEEIIRQFVEQGMVDARCQLIAIIAPQYFDHSLKGTLRYLARLAGKKVVFIGLDEVCKIIEKNNTISL